MKNLTIGLIGNPNSGKTTLFNQLTGSRQRVGIPCISVMGAVARESSRGWMTFSVLWGLNIAYSLSILYYQTVSFNAVQPGLYSGGPVVQCGVDWRVTSRSEPRKYQPAIDS